MDLQAALQSNNVQGFLRVIRQGESNQDDSAYTILFGGEHFDSFADHPRRPITRGSLTSTAAGAYQILAKTWDGLVRQYGFSDFSPASQDAAAVALIAGRGALQLVLDGRCREAIARCAKEWASLPGSPYGQPTLTLEEAIQVYKAYGGTETPQAPQSEEVTPMPAILAALLPTILQSLPQLISVFGSPNDSEVAKRNQAAGVLVADTLVKATQAVNLQDAVEKLQDPTSLAAAHDAINNLIPSLVETGDGGIGAARKASADPAQLPFWKQPSFFFLVVSVPLVYMLAVSVLFGLGGTSWSDDAKMMVATGILAVLAGGSAYFWGSSMGSAKKTDALLK